MRVKKGVILLLLYAAVVFAGAGCATTESDNLSERPWNAPKNWENGLPTEMFEGR